MIVVTGASGRVGGLLAAELAQRGEAARLVVRDASRAPGVTGAKVVVADYGDSESLAAALHEGDRVFMVSLHEPPERRVPLHRSFVEAATRAGVAQIVYLSFLNAGLDATFRHAQSHGATEEMLERSGVPFVAVRNGMYADEIPTWFDADGVARGPAGDGSITFSYRPELAEAIAALLVAPVGESRIVNVVGEPVTLAELAQVATEVMETRYGYDPIGDDAWVAERLALGRPEWAVEAGLSSYRALRSGELAVESDDYKTLTGKPALTVAQVIERQRDEMPLSG